MRYLAAVARGVVEVMSGPGAPLDPGSVRVQVQYAGICHSDTAGLHEAGGPFPYRMGHEVSGTVVESAAAELPAGTRVIAHVDDGYATEVVTPASAVVAIDSVCDLIDAALAEPLACVIGAIDMLDLARLDRVVVVGAGFMGLLTIAYMAAIGHRVTVLELRPKTRRLALELGAESALDPADAEIPLLASSLVIEATGTSSGLTIAGDLVTTGGTLGILGYHQSKQGCRTVDMRGWNFRALKVLNLQHRERTDMLRWIGRAQRISARGVVNPGRLVDSTVGLDQLPDVFQDGPPGQSAVKTVLRPEGQS